MREYVMPLFEPLVVRGKTLRNRIVLPPMMANRPLTSPAAVAWYGQRAQGGAALVIVEATRLFQFDAELSADNLRPLVAAIHAGGALAAIQLYPMLANRLREPHELTLDDIDALVAAYARVGAVCREAGFDGVEPHGAHNYLLNRFFSPLQNQRRDAYGGHSLETRMRLAEQVVSVLRPICDDDMILLYRHTPQGQGYGIDDSLTLARRLVAAGLDILDLSPSSIDAPGDLTAPFAGLGVPVVAVNDLDVISSAVEVLVQGRADLVAVGRGLIADPCWPTKVREGREHEIISCIKCDGCSRDQQAGVPVGCTQWPKEVHH
jgi:2,4-dienoyl-CoA reductase-like NADH-dependent reductase (Old Yellow Enzyme family)